MYQSYNKPTFNNLMDFFNGKSFDIILMRKIWHFYCSFSNDSTASIAVEGLKSGDSFHGKDILILISYAHFYLILSHVIIIIIVNAFRWKRDSNGEKVTNGDKPVAQFIAVQRRDNNEWAIPGVSEIIINN